MPTLMPSLLPLLLFLLLSPSNAIRSFPIQEHHHHHLFELPRFAEAPDYRNGPECPLRQQQQLQQQCDPSLVHIALTLDSQYIRGSIAAVHSVIKHASCPENVFFHFISTSDRHESSFPSLVRSTFPSLNFKVYHFDPSRVTDLISSSIRQALDNPLNYARNYLPDILRDPCLHRVIYLDSDLILVDDVSKLWSVPLTNSRVVGAPEYCHANFTNYFTDAFWADPVMPRVFGGRGRGRRPCYFNTGVMVVDLRRWRDGGFTRRIERWMEVQRERRIYELGSLPPFLLVFGGDVEPIDHRWNQHGLGGDNVMGSCRGLHPGPVSLLHWSGKGKPWARLDARNPCPLDHLWAPYDLHLHSQQLS